MYNSKEMETVLITENIVKKAEWKQKWNKDEL